MSSDMYVVSGATSRTGSIVADALLKRGVRVRVLGRNAQRLQHFVGRGAEAFELDPLDPVTTLQAYSGAKRAFIMLQPNYIPDCPDFRAFQDQLIYAVGNAVEKAGVEQIVSLSSWGAHKQGYTGPVVGLHLLEQRLNRIPSLDAIHLRAGYFMENLFSQIPAVKTRNELSAPFLPTVPLPLVATADIGRRAAEALINFGTGKTRILELYGPRAFTMNKVAAVIGEAVSKPGLTYVQESLDTFRRGLLASGCSENVAELMIEVVVGINSGHISTVQAPLPDDGSITSLASFVKTRWLPLFNGYEI